MSANHEHRMPEWSEAQIKRFNFRHGLFQRRGVEFFEAEKLADGLAFRDYEKDDRRMCLECRHLQRDRKCFHVTQGTLLDVVSKRLEPVVAILQRCPNFEFQTP